MLLPEFLGKLSKFELRVLSLKDWYGCTEMLWKHLIVYCRDSKGSSF